MWLTFKISTFAKPNFHAIQDANVLRFPNPGNGSQLWAHVRVGLRCSHLPRTFSSRNIKNNKKVGPTTFDKALYYIR